MSQSPKRVDLHNTPPRPSTEAKKPAGIVPTTPAERAKFFIVIGVFVLTVAGLLYSAWWSGVFTRRPVAQVLDTPGWRLARDLGKKINEQLEFRDVGLTVTSEKPLHFKVFGGVYLAEDVGKLNELLKTLRPEGDYDVEVEVLGGSPPPPTGGGDGG
jgi:hypothetical protein